MGVRRTRGDMLSLSARSDDIGVVVVEILAGARAERDERPARGEEEDSVSGLDGGRLGSIGETAEISSVQLLLVLDDDEEEGTVTVSAETVVSVAEGCCRSASLCSSCVCLCGVFCVCICVLLILSLSPASSSLNGSASPSSSSVIACRALSLAVNSASR